MREWVCFCVHVVGSDWVVPLSGEREKNLTVLWGLKRKTGVDQGGKGDCCFEFVRWRALELDLIVSHGPTSVWKAGRGGGWGPPLSNVPLEALSCDCSWLFSVFSKSLGQSTYLLNKGIKSREVDFFYLWRGWFLAEVPARSNEKEDNSQFSTLLPKNAILLARVNLMKLQVTNQRSTVSW